MGFNGHVHGTSYTCILHIIKTPCASRRIRLKILHILHINYSDCQKNTVEAYVWKKYVCIFNARNKDVVVVVVVSALTCAGKSSTFELARIFRATVSYLSVQFGHKVFVKSEPSPLNISLPAINSGFKQALVNFRLQ